MISTEFLKRSVKAHKPITKLQGVRNEVLIMEVLRVISTALNVVMSILLSSK